ncbi:hypothetical protein MCEROE11_00984 [Candidatus Nanopelagicaceae bacterium]
MKSRYIFTASAVFLSAALAVNFFSTDSNMPTSRASAIPTPVAIPATLKDSEVLTWNCEIPEYKPESIMLTCADGGWMVHSITWSKWATVGAEGTGIFREKLCEPNCAEGETAEEKVKVKLSDLEERKGEFYLRTLDISTTSGKDFISGRANGLQWDVMEFIEVMSWDE